jgi:Zn-dependent peptidase ImmA (M78 family)
VPRHLITRDLRASPRRSVTVLAEQVRRYLGVTLEEQRSWPNADVAFKAWRTALERVGVFVFKRPFKQQEVSAFCLHDDEFPLIMINNGTSFTRQIFSLFHELAHLLYGVGGITTEDQSYIDNLGGTDRVIEIACNRFAAELLVPRAGFPAQRFRGNVDIQDTVADVAKSYNVSREVILRRLRDEGSIPESTYTRLAAAWTRTIDAAPEARVVETTISFAQHISVTPTSTSPFRNSMPAASI